MNSSDKAFRNDMLMLAMADPEAINDENFCCNSNKEDKSYDYEESLMDWDIIIEDAIQRNDKEALALARKGKQREKTRMRMERKLNEENKTIRDLLIT